MDVLGIQQSLGCPEDEYDVLVGGTMRLLEQAADEYKIARRLHWLLEHHYGLGPDVPPTEEMASKVKAWFETQWRDSVV